MNFGVEISGDNEQRPAPADAHDQGTADEPECLGGNLNSISAVKGEASKVDVNDGQLNFQNLDKAWIYDANGALVKYLDSPASVKTSSLAAGVYLIKMQSGHIFRSQKVAVKLRVQHRTAILVTGLA